MGTTAPARSTMRMSRLSIIRFWPPETSFTGSFAGMATSMSLLMVLMRGWHRMRSARSASLRQYLITSSFLFVHSSSIFVALMLSLVSPNSMFDT